MPLGVLISGILSEVWGIRPLYILIGALIASISLLGMLLPYFAFMDKEDTNEKLAS